MYSVAEIELRNIFLALRKNLLILVAMGMLGLLTAYIVSEHFLHRRYEARVKFYAFTDWGENPIHEVNALLFAQRAVNSYIQILRSNNFRSDVIEDAELNIFPNQLGSMISFRILNDTEVFEARIVSRSPDLSLHIANSVARVAPLTIYNFSGGKSISIIDYPIHPHGAFFPNIQLNATIGFIAGILFSAAYILIKDIVRDRLRDEVDFTKRFDVTVLAVIPSSKR